MNVGISRHRIDHRLDDTRHMHYKIDEKIPNLDLKRTNMVIIRVDLPFGLPPMNMACGMPPAFGGDTFGGDMSPVGPVDCAVAALAAAVLLFVADASLLFVVVPGRRGIIGIFYNNRIKKISFVHDSHTS